MAMIGEGIQVANYQIAGLMPPPWGKDIAERAASSKLCQFNPYTIKSCPAIPKDVCEANGIAYQTAYVRHGSHNPCSLLEPRAALGHMTPLLGLELCSPPSSAERVQEHLLGCRVGYFLRR